jgi:TonB family protein
MGRRIQGAVLSAVLGLLATGIPASGARADEPARLIQRPDWAQIPTGDELARYYPDRAMREGVSGKAILTCAVTAEGLLTACSAVEDKPGGYDFDKAALALSASFRMKSATRDGKPVAGGEIIIPIVFQVPEGPAMGPHGMKFGDGTIIVTKLVASKVASLDPRAIVFDCPGDQGRCQGHPIAWAERPDPAVTADILRRAGQVAGLSIASCVIAADGRLNDCEVSGQVTDAAAVAAVKEATGLMRSAAQTVDGAAAAGARVQIPFQWDWLLAGLKAAS